MRIERIQRNLFYILLIAFFTGCTSVEIAAKSGSGSVPYEIAPISAPFDMPQLQRPEIPERVFNIVDFGAKQRHENGEELVTGPIHDAIEKAYKAGGGMVLIPEGEWLTGPIHLMSNINLHLVEGARVYFSENREDYLPVVPQRHEGVEAYNYSPPIYAYKVSNVAITGKGEFDGQGQQWWDWYREHGAPNRDIAARLPLSRREFGKGSGMEGMRPSFAVFWKSENILIEGVTFTDGPMWNLQLIYCNSAIIRDVTINSLYAPNGDGIVIDSSKDVLIEYVHLETGDDAVVIKSGFNEDGLNINIPSENIVVRNFQAVDVRTGSGGIVFGSETSGGIRNVYVHDALFEGSDRGIRFKTNRPRGNVTENIYIRDIEMRNISDQAINFETSYWYRNATGPSPMIRNIDIRNVSIDGVPQAIELIGLPELWLMDIHLENIKVTNAGQGVNIQRVKNLTMKNVSVSSVERAFIADEIFELYLENVTFSDETGKPPAIISGRYTDVIVVDEGFPMDAIELIDGLSRNIIGNEIPPLAR